jgi:AraC-like DNA-binding protein
MRCCGQLLAAFDGLMSLWTESGRWLVPAGHCAWVPPEQPYSVRAHEPFAGRVADIVKEACLTLPQKPCSFVTSGLLREAILRVRGSESGSCDPEQNLLAMIICQEIRKLPQTGVGIALPRDPRLLRITTAIADDLADNRGLEEWATWTGMSTRTLVRRFMQETGLSFTEWRRQARVMRALEWLASGTSVTTVALDLGYDTVSAFIAMFRHAVGMTPTAYLNSIGAGDRVPARRLSAGLPVEDRVS